MIVFDNVCFSYGAAPVVENLSFRIRRGEFVAVVGPNGAGKTTVSKLACGLLKPTGGTVTVGGFDTSLTRASKIAEITGVLFQNPDRQICTNTVGEEIAFNLKILGRPKAEIDARVAELTEKLGFDPAAAPFRLSRGQRQRLSLAAALAARPKILILDEPTTGLDYRECMKMMELICAENRLGTTVVMVCHDMEVVSDFAQRVLVVAEGRLLADGTPDRVFFDPDLCARACLLPPQIAELSMRLGGRYHGFREVDALHLVIRAGLNRRAEP